MAANKKCCRNIDEYGLVGSSGAPVAPSGELIVAGYVVTKHFSVFMDSIDAVGKIKYDLKAKKISFTEGRGEAIWK